MRKIFWGFILCFTTVFAVAYTINFTGEREHTIHQIKAEESLSAEKKVYDESLCNELITALDKLDITKHDFSIHGLITVYNPLDSTENIDRMPYTVIKTPDFYYYKAGNSETINGKKGYVYVDHNGMTIIAESTKSFNVGIAVPDAKKLIEILEKENYQLWSTEDSLRKTIVLENPYSLNHHKFSLTIDKSKGIPLNVYTAVPNLKDPSDKSLDRVINYTVNIAAISKKDFSPVLQNYITGGKESIVNQYNTYLYLTGK